MGEFKKGDVIRAKRDINGFFDKGANYRIAKKIGQNFVLTDNDEPELQDAKHHTDLSWLIENFELVTLKIEGGKFYKTRAGRKVGPVRLKATHGSDGPYRIDGLWNYLENGLVGSISNGDHKDDLIAEWIDEPVAKASTTTASNDNAQPKFKVGDRVKLARSFFGVAKVGATATVGERGMFSDYVDIVWDKNHLYQGQMNGGYSPDYFELLPASPPTTAIVALIENGQPKPSSTPHVHTSTEAAEKEATRLAAKYKGKKFGVFTLTATHEEAAPVYDHKWQNMAALGLKIGAIKELRAVAGLTLKGAKDAVEVWIEYENAA